MGFFRSFLDSGRKTLLMRLVANIEINCTEIERRGCKDDFLGQIERQGEAMKAQLCGKTVKRVLWELGGVHERARQKQKEDLVAYTAMLLVGVLVECLLRSRENPVEWMGLTNAIEDSNRCGFVMLYADLKAHEIYHEILGIEVPPLSDFDSEG